MPRPKSKEAVIEEFRVQTIQEATMRVVAKKGLGDLTMAEVAKEAGIAKGTIYLYFKDRQDLLNSTVEHAFGKLGERVQLALSGNGTFGERFDLLIRTQLEFFDENHEFFRVHLAMSDCNSGAGKRAQPHPRYLGYLERLARFFDEAVTRGEMRPVDTTRLALFVAEGMRGIVFRRIVEKEPPPLSADVSLITATILQGVALERSKH
jgi:AcrR family transcriptional regulator